MKFNKVYIAIFILATVIFTACSEYEDTVEPSHTVADDCPAVRFASDNKTVVELDPADLSLSLTVVRNNGSAALEVPVTVLTDTGNVFSVPGTLSFSAGEDTTSLTITMNASAQTGTAFGLQVTFDDKYINPYLAADYPIYGGEVSIVTWSTLGTVQFYDSFSFYSVSEVTLEQRDDNSDVYRITSPYRRDILTEAEWGDWIGGDTQEKIVFTVDEDNVTWDGFWYTNLLNEGISGQAIKAYFPSAINKDGDDKSVVVKAQDGTIKYFELYPSFYVDGAGGWGLKVVYLGFPGYDLAGDLGISVFGK